jgi:SWI/SNF-related matrix-associated actin-dependent regulator 1 of chromatin subfamily A
LKLSYPRNGWAQVRWFEDEAVPEKVVDVIMRLDDLPGVEVQADHVMVPRNVWETEDWRALRAHVQHSVQYSNIRAFSTLWHPEQPLYDHQVQAAAFLVAHGGGLCADQMGLGKTREAIVAAETLADEAPERHRIIIGPKYTRDVWRRELLAVGAIKSDEEFWFAEGRSPNDKPVDWDCRWFFIHYDIAHWWTTFLTQGRHGLPIAAIIDEAHWIKNGRTKRAKATQAIAGCAPYRILLTGTPMANRPAELWWPLTVLDGKRSWGSPVDFRVRYAGATHNGMGYEDQGPTHTDELQQRLSNRYIRRTIESAEVKLPALTRQLMRVQLSDKDQGAYDTLQAKVGKDNLVRAVLERRAGRDTLAAITRMRKLTSRAKEETTQQYIKAALDAGDSVVVFTWQRETAERIADDNAWLIHGGFPQEQRDRDVAAFQAHGGLLVATIDALKEGVTLTKARHVVLHDLSWVPSDILQAEARVHRIGQDKPVQSTWVVADDTIDMLFAATLTTKASAMAEALGITAAQDAAAELGLEDFSVSSSVEDEINRLLGAWDR